MSLHALDQRRMPGDATTVQVVVAGRDVDDAETLAHSMGDEALQARAVSTEEALAVAAASTVDVVVLVVGRMGEDGLGDLMALCASYPSTPVMAVVRDGGELARVALLHAGADQVTSADVESEAIRAMIRTLLRVRLGRPGPQGWPDPRTIDLDASRQSAQIGEIEAAW